MSELLDNAKLLILPSWLCATLEAHEMKPIDIVTMEGLESILSPADVRFYQRQVDDLISVSGKDSQSPEASPIGSLFASIPPLHTNYVAPRNGASQASPEVKINTLYGKSIVQYNFFPGLAMSGYVPRMLIPALGDQVSADPYLELASTDLFVLKFSLGMYEEDRICDGYPKPARQFVRNSLDLLIGNYGFEQASQTSLFEFYALLPYAG